MVLFQNDSISIFRAKSPSDFLFARQLRNKCFENMTNNRKHISLWGQIIFYLNCPDNIKLYIATVEGCMAGYLLLRKQDDFYFITEAVDQKHQNKGVASSMIKFAQNNKSYLIAEILKNNLPSINLHKKLGFIEISGDENVVRYQYGWSE